MTVAPGWYPNPSNDGSLAYWDGAAWTGQTWVPPVQAPAPAQPVAVRYKFKTVHGSAAVKRHLSRGWEIADSSGRESWVWGSNYKAIMRKPK